jgi:hypothetical protein
MKYLIASDNGEYEHPLEICGDLIDEELLRLLGTLRRGFSSFKSRTVHKKERCLPAGRQTTSLSFGKVKRLVEMGNIHIHQDLIAGFTTRITILTENLQRCLRPERTTFSLGFLKLIKGTALSGTCGGGMGMSTGSRRLMRSFPADTCRLSALCGSRRSRTP